jgi:hypothetical protein
MHDKKEEPRCGTAGPQRGQSFCPEAHRGTAQSEGAESRTSAMDQATEIAASYVSYRQLTSLADSAPARQQRLIVVLRPVERRLHA